MKYSFTKFIGTLLIESLHPEIAEIIHNPSRSGSKTTLITKKIKELSERGEDSGLESNMPKGSSRVYLPHSEEENVILDGKPAKIKSGTKVSIKASLDRFHNINNFDNRTLGELQNEAEGGDWLINDHYRILRKDDDDNFVSNKEQGIFPPLFDHDDRNHQWSHVGHIKSIKKPEFNRHTKTDEFPKGISHNDFINVMNRFHERNNGKYWEKDKSVESKLDKIENHPLVQKFMDFHGNFGHPTYDYQQIKNMGVFEHPDGSKHIVARDHGFNTKVMDAYAKARIASQKLRM